MRQRSYRQQRLEKRVKRIPQLTIRDQAQCVLFVSEIALPVWKLREENFGMAGRGDAYLAVAREWLAGRATDAHLTAAWDSVLGPDPSLSNIRSDPIAGAGHSALLTFAAVALSRAPDRFEPDEVEMLHSDYIFSGVAAAAVAVTGVVVPGNRDSLTDAHLDLLDRWWDECCARFPVLRTGTEMLAFIEYDCAAMWLPPDALGPELPPFSEAAGEPESVTERGGLTTGPLDDPFPGAVAGVRNTSGMPPLFPPRGAPANPSLAVWRQLSDAGELGEHDAGWLRPSEVEAALHHHRVDRATLYLESLTILGILRDLAARLGDDRVRFVFGYW